MKTIYISECSDQAKTASESAHRTFPHGFISKELKTLNKPHSIILLVGLVVTFIFIGIVSAQEIDKERAIGIIQTQGGPAGCTDEASCSSFCENPDNYETCINWARDNGLVSSEEADRAHKVAKVGREFSGPGGCSSHQECQSFCEQPQNHDTCIDFAVSQGFMTQEEADRIKEFRGEAERFREETERGRERFEQEFEIDPEFDKDKALLIIESQGGPGGCGSFEECEAFCENPQNQEACFEFAEEHGLFKNPGHAEKIKRVLKDGGPGGCRGESQCRQFCENPDNFETCIEFAEKNEFIPPAEVEKAKKGIRALKEGGPGGCRTPKECEEICRNPANQDNCFEWAKKHGLMSEEELKKIEEFKRRGEELRREFEQRREEFEKRGEEFKPPEGFHPPGEFLGPGGCVGADQCREYCQNPAHKEECEKFFRTPSGIVPPGFGEPPPEVEGTFPTSQCFNDPCANWPSGEACPIKAPVVPVACNDPSCNSGPCIGAGTVSPPPGFDPATECAKKGGTWIGTTCEFTEITPSPSPTGTPYSELDHVTECTKQGGAWDGKTCIFPSPTYSPTPTTIYDPATGCVGAGGTWDSATNTCKIPQYQSLISKTRAFIFEAFRDFLR